MQIREECTCKASVNFVGPESSSELLFKQLNSWRRYHVCPLRNKDSQPKAPEDWTKQGIGHPCAVCERLLEDVDTDIWRIDHYWVHLSCVECLVCHKLAVGNGSMVRSATGSDEGFVHTRCLGRSPSPK